MELTSMLNVRNAAKLGGILLPILVICGLIALWVLIVIICQDLRSGQSVAVLIGNILAH